MEEILWWRTDGEGPQWETLSEDENGSAEMDIRPASSGCICLPN
jgi:hypothetical protein